MFESSQFSAMAVAPDGHGQTRSSMAESEDKLTMSDHFEVCQSLKDLGNPNTQRRLGEALGLLYPTLQKMSSFPDEMVAAWLNREDNVIRCSGEPTWNTLEDALRKIGQTGLAEDVKTKRICHGTSHKSSEDGQIDSATQTDSGIPPVASSSGEETAEDLYQWVTTDTRRIKRKFSTLQEEVWKSISDIQRLVRLILGMSMLSKDDEEQIRKTPSSVSIILTKYWSFLDFENLEHIVEHKCSSAEKKMMKEYKEQVYRFCRMRVSELPSKFNSLSSSSNEYAGMKKLCVTLDLHDPALQSVKHLKMAIANILGCRASDLVLQNIEPGSVIATYLINAFIGAKLFERGMTAKQEAALKANKVMLIRYEAITIFDAQNMQPVSTKISTKKNTERREKNVEVVLRDKTKKNVRKDRPPYYSELYAVGILIILVFIVYRGITEGSAKREDLIPYDTWISVVATAALLTILFIAIFIIIILWRWLKFSTLQDQQIKLQDPRLSQDLVFRVHDVRDDINILKKRAASFKIKR